MSLLKKWLRCVMPVKLSKISDNVSWRPATRNVQLKSLGVMLRLNTCRI